MIEYQPAKWIACADSLDCMLMEAFAEAIQANTPANRKQEIKEQL